MESGIRGYRESDFENVAKLLKQMYDHIWIDVFHWKGMSLKDAREAVKTDCLASDTKVFIAEHGPQKKPVGFISFAVRYGGTYYIEYLWVEEAHRKYGYEEKLLKAVEEHAQRHGHDAVHVRVNVNIPEEMEFFLNRGYKVLKVLETAKYFKEPTYISGKNIKVAGYRFKLR